MADRKRVGIFGWGVVAPKSPNIEAFERNLERADSWLTPFRGYGQSNFLVGDPEFDFETYHEWFDERFKPAKYAQLADKMRPMVKFAIGAFIQSPKSGSKRNTTGKNSGPPGATRCSSI